MILVASAGHFNNRKLKRTGSTGSAISFYLTALTPLQVSGANRVAPSMFMFDAMVGLTTTDPGITTDDHRWRLMTYDYQVFLGGVALATTYAATGAKKGEQLGSVPLFGFLAESAGSYEVRCTARNLLGQTAVASLFFTVDDPNTYYQGNRTILVSPSGNYDAEDYPAGLVGTPLTMTGIPNGGVNSTYNGADDRRYLLYREAAGTWHNDIKLSREGQASAVPNRLHFDSYGPGGNPKPTVRHIQVGSAHTPGHAGWGYDNKFVGLRVMPNGVQTSGYSSSYPTDRTVLHACDFDPNRESTTNNIISLAGSTAWFMQGNSSGWSVPGGAAAYHWPRHCSYTDLTVDGNQLWDSDAPGEIHTERQYAIYANQGGESLFAGLNFRKMGNHQWRGAGWYKTLFRGCRMAGGISDHNPLDFKLHSLGMRQWQWQPYTDGGAGASSNIAMWSQYCAFVENICNANTASDGYSTTTAWCLNMMPQNNTANGNELLMDCMADNNQFYWGAISQFDVTMIGTRMTARRNTRIGTGGGITVGRGDTTLNYMYPGGWSAEFRAATEAGPYYVS